jgi:hypothetical protein
MMITFDRAKWTQDSDGFCWLSLRAKAPQFVRKFVQSMKDCLYVAEFKEYREKRSLDSNSYFWLLAGKLAAVLTQGKTIVSPEEIYRSYIPRIGDNSQTVPIRDDAKEQWIKAWQAHGKGWICEDLGSKLDGYTNIICYYGSSVYDTAQMSRLITLVVQDCQDQGIETKTPEELALMESEWDT